jgi:hypothetical protein
LAINDHCNPLAKERMVIGAEHSNAVLFHHVPALNIVSKAIAAPTKMHPPKRGDESNTLAVLAPQVSFPRDLGLVATGDSAYARVAGMVSSTSVPELRLLRTASLPPTSLARSSMPGRPKCPEHPPSRTTAGRSPFRYPPLGADRESPGV